MANYASLELAASRILLADDDPILCELAQAKLEKTGYQVFKAANGKQALEILTRESIDLIISDLNMPVMDGFELTRSVRAASALKHTPVIVITGYDQESAVDDAFAAGATSFLVKPINWALFSHSVRFVLRASKVERALRSARDQAEAGAKFKNSLISVMSHELRTPLNAIIGFGQLISEKFEATDDRLYKEYADYIVEGGRRLLDNVSDMLLAGDARSGPVAIHETDAAISDIVSLAQKGLEKTIDESGANVLVTIQESDLELCCDRQLVARAIAKLVDNAVKFSPRGVNVVIAATRTKSGRLALLVQDDGPGIDKNTLREALTPFSSSDISQRRSCEGMGLGLPLVKAIGKAHGAVFRVESRPGGGTRAILLFPSKRIVAPRPKERAGAA